MISLPVGRSYWVTNVSVIQITGDSPMPVARLVFDLKLESPAPDPIGSQTYRTSKDAGKTRSKIDESDSELIEICLPIHTSETKPPVDAAR
jgi:hypothetical protein